MTNNNPPQNYKNSEIGIIPQDWEVKTIKDISTPVRGGSPRPAGDPRYFNGNFIPWLTVAALTNIPISQIYVSETESYLTQEGSLHSRILEKDTLIIANSGATLGVAKLLAIKCCANDGIAALFDFNKEISKTYVVYFINTKIKYLREVVATGNGQPNLNTDLIGNIKIPLPPTLSEQTAIANALSDTDALISSLEKLIEKKRNIKQGAMQKLLQPKEGWEVKKLGEICYPSNSRLNPVTSSQNYKCIELEHISQGSGMLIGYSNSKDLLSHKSIFEKGDVLFGKLRPYLRKFYFADFDGVCTTEIWVLKTVNGTYNKFLYYLVQSEKIVEVANLSTGTKMPRAEWKTVASTLINFPPTIEEQTRIATILSDMDAEIEGLEAKLEKYRAIKLGMMQELLTGKTRLV